MNEEIIQNINERLDTAVEKGREIIEDENFQLRVEELKSSAENTIRKHPLAAVASGLALGFIVAKLFNSGD